MKLRAGDPADLPVVPGHQVVGVVADKGKSVTRFKIGDRVGITWLFSSCGKCRFCLGDNENLCAQAKFTGLDANGGYAEFIVVHEDFAHIIPPNFSNSSAAPLLCAGLIGYRAFKLADISDGDSIGIFGFGASAHIVIQIIKHKFPDNPVFVFTRSPDKKQLATDLGAEWTGSPGDTPATKINRAFDFTPVGISVLNALAVLDKAGRLIINAIRKITPIPELDYAKYLWLEKEIKSVANVTRQDTREFLTLASLIPIEPVVNQFQFEQANEALIALKHSQIHGAGVLKVTD